jgi:hypothetical protein
VVDKRKIFIGITTISAIGILGYFIYKAYTQGKIQYPQIVKPLYIYPKGFIPPIYFENYDEHWGFTDFKNKVILDLGADYGSTAYYFLNKGALKVIAVEGDKYLAERLKLNFKDDPRVVPIYLEIKSGKDIEELIDMYHPDIVKVDIEGAEINILSVNIRKVKEWLIETHTDEIYNALAEWFRMNGFNIKTYPYGINFKTFPYLQRFKIIYAWM